MPDRRGGMGSRQHPTQNLGGYGVGTVPAHIAAGCDDVIRASAELGRERPRVRPIPPLRHRGDVTDQRNRRDEDPLPTVAYRAHVDVETTLESVSVPSTTFASKLDAC